ncbi:hypothetical protein GCM10017687_38140 [Streptomyces echinatus]
MQVEGLHPGFRPGPATAAAARRHLDGDAPRPVAGGTAVPPAPGEDGQQGAPEGEDEDTGEDGHGDGGRPGADGPGAEAGQRHDEPSGRRTR